MAPIRQSNLARKQGREECREKLSEHIRNTLNIEIPPSQIRLNPGTNDPYIWKVLPERQDVFSKIFAKNLSDHSISTYRLLRDEVGKTFEAVLPSTQGPAAPSVVTAFPEPSFSFTIDQLNEERARLSQEACEWRSKAAAELEHRRAAESQVQLLQGVQQQLQDELLRHKAATGYFKSVALKGFSGLDKVLPMLEGLKNDMCLDEITI